MRAHARTIALGAAILLAAVAYFVRLGTPDWGAGAPRYLFDEKYTAFTAHRVLLGDPAAFKWAARRFEYLPAGRADLTLTSRAEWTSPPGAPLAVVPFIAAFGFSATAARVASVLAALIVLAATAWLAGLRRAWCACALLAFDGAFFVLARTSMPYMFLVAGLTAGAALLSHAVQTGRRRTLAAVAAGVAFGFAASVRLTAIPFVACFALAAALGAPAGWRAMRVPLLAMIAAALATYAATFVPHLCHGASPADLVQLHRAMSWFHARVPRDFPQGTRWYTWPFALRPVVFDRRAVGGGVAVVWCVGGRLLWWGLLPALLYGVKKVLEKTRGRGVAQLMPVAAIVATFAPWAALDRFGMAYHLLPALPFVALLLAQAFDRPRAPWSAPAAVALALVMFAASYPILAAVPLSKPTLARYAVLFAP